MPDMQNNPIKIGSKSFFSCTSKIFLLVKSSKVAELWNIDQFLAAALCMVQTDLSMNRNKIDNILVARTKEFYVLSSPAATLRPRPSPGQQPRPSTLHIVVKNEAK